MCYTWQALPDFYCPTLNRIHVLLLSEGKATWGFLPCVFNSPLCFYFPFLFFLFSVLGGLCIDKQAETKADSILWRLLALTQGPETSLWGHRPTNAFSQCNCSNAINRQLLTAQNGNIHSEQSIQNSKVKLWRSCLTEEFIRSTHKPKLKNKAFHSTGDSPWICMKHLSEITPKVKCLTRGICGANRPLLIRCNLGNK